MTMQVLGRQTYLQYFETCNPFRGVNLGIANK